MEKIDFVVTWVDNSDEKWRMKKNKFKKDDKFPDMNDINRYRDFGLFKYWFRAVEKYAPWVNKIYIITEGHLPLWLDISSDKIVHIKHEDYLPQKYLPTFSSRPIELNLHRIENLSENFVLFNDDMFLNTDTVPTDFFKNDFARDFSVYSPIIPDGDITTIAFNNVKIINKNFDKKKNMRRNWRKFCALRYRQNLLRTVLTLPYKKIAGYYNPHTVSCLKKSIIKEVWDREFDVMDATSTNKFREVTDVNQWLFRYWQIERGLTIPQNFSFSSYFSISEYKEIMKIMEKEKSKIICINDTEEWSSEIDNQVKEIMRSFDKKFPNKSVYEL
ncbi:Stealth CR1 domain-containing protein [Enterococcus casseliflavus]|uniref:Stealth CR1 domain-containing protein n=1 Tax=Enterococcus casseliflavus TaxID=37734 RepID=UPI0022E08F28|nr:Stealth CR1 domain-containing protein [Enterococcus casseliflavus]